MNRYPSPPLSAKWRTTTSPGPGHGHGHGHDHNQRSDQDVESKLSMHSRQLPPLSSLRLPPPQSQSQYSLCHLALTPINGSNTATRQLTKLPSPTSPHGQEQIQTQVLQVQPQVQGPAQAIRPSPYPRPTIRSDTQAQIQQDKRSVQRQSMPIPNGPRPPSDIGRPRPSTDYSRPRPPPNEYLSRPRSYIFKNISSDSFGSAYDFETMGYDAIGAQVSRQAANSAAEAVAKSTGKSVPTSTWCQCPRCKATRERQRQERRI